jgi:type I restriction enzyme S subunit
MTDLDRLIAEFCPNGVDFVTLAIVAKISNGKDHKHLADGEYPVYGSGGIMRYAEEYMYDQESVLIPRKGSIGNIFYINTPFWTVDTIFYTKIDQRKIVPKFLYYFLQTQHIEDLNMAGGVPSLTKTELEKIHIPLPPLPIQQEIVRILDTFTRLTAELEAELEARKKQYEYYRNGLLSFEHTREDVEWATLGEICTNVTSGGTPLASRDDYYGGDIPWLRTQEVRFVDILDTDIKITAEGLANSSAKWIPENCVIVAISGATAARAGINKIPLTTNQHCCNLEVDALQANYRYVFHWVSKEYESLKALGQGARADLNAGIIKNYPIPVPPLEEQQRIVAILDRFDALTNDITSGLPAELEARHKQYEYYRDTLLTFKEKIA